MRRLHVLVAGGGIGGIVTALALNQRGFVVLLYEQSPELHELGAGIAIMPNARGCCASLACDLLWRRPPRCPQVAKCACSTQDKLGLCWLKRAAHHSGQYIAATCIRLSRQPWNNARPEPSMLAPVA